MYTLWHDFSNNNVQNTFKELQSKTKILCKKMRSTYINNEELLISCELMLRILFLF